MNVRILFWKNLKKRKTFSIVIFLLMIIVSFTLITATSTYMNVNHHMEEALKATHAPDYMNWMPSSAEELDTAWYHQLQEHPDVDHVELQSLISISSSIVFINSSIMDNTLYLKEYEPFKHSFALRNHPQDQLPERGYVYLPYAFQHSYQCAIGDIVTIKLPNATYTYEIQDFYEDPINGNTMFGMKYILFSEDDYSILLASANPSTHMEVTQVNTFLQPTENLSETLYHLNQDVDLGTHGEFSYPITFFTDASQIVPSLMLFVIIGFSFLMFFITLLVLSYALKASISEDTTEIGIMKAVGFSERQISALSYLQYGSVALSGFLIGALGSCFALLPLEQMVQTSSGMFSVGTIHPIVMILTGLLLMCCIFLMVMLNTRKIKRISCVHALSTKTDDIYFASRLNISLENIKFLPLTLRLSLKHVVTHLKQYTMILFISLLLTECLLTILTVNSYFQIEGMASITGGMDSDIYINYETEEDYHQIPALLEQIDDTDPIQSAYPSGGEHLIVNGSQLYIVFMEEFKASYMTSPFIGRFPVYDNEIVITEMVLQFLQKEVGDTVTVTSNDGISMEYLIVGAHQTFNEMGKQCLMSAEGIARLGIKPLGYRYNIQFQERGQRTDLVQQLNEQLADRDTKLRVVDEYGNIKQYAEAQQIAILSLTLLIILLTIVLIGMITFLLAKISIEKEKRDLAILRFQGFTLKQLQRQFAMRYLFVSSLGVLLGILLNMSTNATIISMIFSNIGITRFTSYYTSASLLFPFLLITGMTYVSSMITTRKIKKIKVQSLTNDA